MASEEMSFENVDGQRTDDGCLYILYAHLGAECSGELIKTDLKSSASSNFPPLHLKNPAKRQTVLQTFTCVFNIFQASKQRYTV